MASVSTDVKLKMHQIFRQFSESCKSVEKNDIRKSINDKNQCPTFPTRSSKRHKQFSSLLASRQIWGAFQEGPDIPEVMMSLYDIIMFGHRKEHSLSSRHVATMVNLENSQAL